MVENIFTDLMSQLKDQLNFNLLDSEEIDAGMSNRLFRQNDQDGKKLLLKVYWKDSSDPRLEREFKAIQLMRTHGITQIPEVYFRNTDLNYAVYSLEDGHHKKAEDLSENDIEKMVDFLVAVHSIKEENVDSVFKIDSNYTLATYTERIKHRINRFTEDLNTNALPDFVM